jgi:hypothetical protein
MATLLEATQEALRKHLHEQIHEAIVDFDATAILQSIKDGTLAKATEISQSLMGLETHWSNLELTHSGLLNKHLGPIVKDLVVKHLDPIVRAEVPRLLATKQIQDLILRTIKMRSKRQRSKFRRVWKLPQRHHRGDGYKRNSEGRRKLDLPASGRRLAKPKITYKRLHTVGAH